MDELKEGDQVKLKSGGPTMTVVHVWAHHIAPGIILCSWFTGTENHKVDFPIAALKEAPADDTPAD